MGSAAIEIARTGLMEEEYRTPEGYYDLPYIFAYDGDALTDGNSYTGIPVFVGNDQAGFVFRQVYGRANLAARIQLRDSAAPFFSGAQGAIIPNTYPIVPEKYFPPGRELFIDLFTVARANRAALPVIIFFAQLAFQGVRRFKGGATYPGPSTYRYYEKAFSYPIDVVVNWAGTDPTPRKRFIEIPDMDFELRRITITRRQQAGVANYGVPVNELKLMLYDPYPRQLMNVPILDAYLIDNADATQNAYNGVFPVPGVMYPKGSAIYFDVTSLLTAAMLPSAYNFVFHGVRRVPIL